MVAGGEAGLSRKTSQFLGAICGKNFAFSGGKYMEDRNRWNKRLFFVRIEIDGAKDYFSFCQGEEHEGDPGPTMYLQNCRE